MAQPGARDKNNERQPEPADIQQENVHIAEITSEIQAEIQAEHKGAIPEIVSKTVSVFDKSGKKIASIEVPDTPSNVCFGGKKRNMYILILT